MLLLNNDLMQIDRLFDEMKHATVVISTIHGFAHFTSKL